MSRPLFFVGLHIPAHAARFPWSMISVNRLLDRRGDFAPQEWIMDSGAFTRITTGKGHLPIDDYVAQISRWARCGRLLAAVSQDWMCEPFVLSITGLSTAEHQRLTIERYKHLRRLSPVYIMPVLQGYSPNEYLDHIYQYGSLLENGAWVGVGSVCKRNASPKSVEDVLKIIHKARPDLRLHGFGVKRTALKSPIVNHLLYSCDSLAWSYAARREGRNQNSADEAEAYVHRIESQPVQAMMEVL